ncbi:MAG: GNAT family N-acetyltransferase [Lachnospiraceae bacterium]|nr:GNAT family N-acetyltransferase [Lachnospiraceae bacterium]
MSVTEQKYELHMVIQRAAVQDIDAIDHLMQEVYAQMEQKDLFVPDDRSFIARHIEQEGFTLIAKSQGVIKAFLIIRLPEDGTDNLGRHLHLSREELQKVAHMESAVVHPSCRGQHLQQQLLDLAEQELRKRGYQYLMCTISPDNTYSLNNAGRQGYEIMDTLPKYGGKLRSVLCKSLSNKKYRKKEK